MQSYRAETDGSDGLPPLVLHVIHRLGVGGLENGVVNLVNRMPAHRYRHAIACMTEAGEFQKRIQRPDVRVHSLRKQDGKGVGALSRLFRLIWRLRPAIVHTRNLATLEGQVCAALAGVPGRIHGEQGRDTTDLYGTRRKYVVLRRALRPCVNHYIAVSADLADWLVRIVGVNANHVSQIYNGVDTLRFTARAEREGPPEVPGFGEQDAFVVGSVSRMHPVKDPLTLARAFILFVQANPAARKRARLLLVGDGPVLPDVRNVLTAAGVQDLVWMPGERSDVAHLLRMMHLFVLPSVAEGTSNTILEAMATGLPVIATAVGGNLELVEPDRTGLLVPPADPVRMAEAITLYFNDPDRAGRCGSAARSRVERLFSLESMIDHSLQVYDSVLTANRRFMPSLGARGKKMHPGVKATTRK